ncbi:MAG: Mur ligase family protein, partial [Clostridia bacterium]
DPQVMVGANLPIIGGGLRVATGDLFIAEACEYCNSFLSFNPTIAVILNVEEDHLDFFSGINDIIKSFHAFAKKVPPFGAVIVNADDESALAAACGLDQRVISFGIENGDVRAQNIENTGSGACFTLFHNGEELAPISLKVCGRHNVYNALAAAAAALELHISPKCIAAGLSKFTGASRRFEHKGEVHGAQVYDDYAHHPSEVRATLTAAREHTNGRIICAFQPHTYTRTMALCDDFAKALSLADVVYLTDIFAAREKNTKGITAELISDKIPGARYIPKFGDVAREILNIAEPGDLILSMGAGDVFHIAEMLVCE